MTLPAVVADLLQREPVRTWTCTARTQEDAIRLASEQAVSGANTQTVRALAIDLSRSVKSVDLFPARAAAWVREKMLYRREHGEVFQGPIATLRAGGGDCDDLAILFASLCLSLQVDALPAAVWYPGGGWCHMIGFSGHRLYELSREQWYSGAPDRGPKQLPAGAYVVAWDPRKSGVVELVQRCRTHVGGCKCGN
ncbi:MAG: transglutaminase family protein [Mycobacterium sp.]|nr:transglutaminase family protein [Mycobacterium sp.]